MTKELLSILMSQLELLGKYSGHGLSYYEGTNHLFLN